MKEPKVLITSQEIDRKVSEIADRLKTDYHDKNPVFIGILKGSFIFMSDLVRKLKLPVQIEFIQLSSYGASSNAPGKIKLIQGLTTPIRNRDVLLIEDIVDTGHTMSFLLDYLGRRKPSSLKVCAMFDKRSRRVIEVPIDYVGFIVPDVFLVGYGLDCGENYRCLPDVCSIEE